MVSEYSQRFYFLENLLETLLFPGKRSFSKETSSSQSDGKKLSRPLLHTAKKMYD
jgi:hypothetical protein